MPQIVLPHPGKDTNLPVAKQVDDLAVRYHNAHGLGIQLLGTFGKQVDELSDQLPENLQKGLYDATLQALEVAFDVAAFSRSRVPDTGTWITRAITVGSGMAGGVGGLSTTLAEIPVTTTLILRAIQGIATEHGLDPADPDTRIDCLQVFATAGPLAEDNQTDISFLAMRIGITGATVEGLIKNIAPQLALVLGQKLGAQTVPVLGAVAGAAINYIFTSYYQEMAHVHFALKRASETHGVPRASLVARLADEMGKKT